MIIDSFKIFEQQSTGEKLEFQLREFNQKKSSLESLIMGNVDKNDDISKKRQDIINSNPFLSKFSVMSSLRASIERLNNRLEKVNSQIRENRSDMSATGRIADTDERKKERDRLKDREKSLNDSKSDIEIRIKEVETDIKDKEKELRDFIKEQEERLRDIKTRFNESIMKQPKFGLGAHIGYWGINYGKDSGDVRGTFGEKGRNDNQMPGMQKRNNPSAMPVLFNPYNNSYITEEEYKELEREYKLKCKVNKKQPIATEKITPEKIAHMYKYVINEGILLESFKKIADNIVEWDEESLKKKINDKSTAKKFIVEVLRRLEGSKSFIKRNALKIALSVVLSFIPTMQILEIGDSYNMETEIKEVLNDIAKKEAALLKKKEEEKVAKSIFKDPLLMTTSKRGIHEIKDVEKLSLVAYNLKDGRITVGYGHAKKPEESKYKVGDRITPQKAEELFKKDLKWAEDGVKRMFAQWENEDIYMKVTQGQFDAMVSMAYNMGVSGLRKSNFVQFVKKEDFRGASNIIPMTALSKRHIKGLKRRRLKEKEYFDLKDIDELLQVNSKKWDRPYTEYLTHIHDKNKKK